LRLFAASEQCHITLRGAGPQKAFCADAIREALRRLRQTQICLGDRAQS